MAAKAVVEDILAVWHATLQKAVALHESGNIADAKHLYEQVLEASPDHFDALHMYGVAQFQLGQCDAALVTLQRVIRQRANDAVAQSHMALVLRALHRLDEALAAHDCALQHKPDFAQAWANRGNVLRDMGRPADAVASFERALFLQSSFPSAHHGKGLALGDIGKWADALQSFDLAISESPGYAVAYLDRGNALRELGRLTDALQSYDNALQINPSYAQAWSNRGVVLRFIGRLDEALESYGRAMAIKPDFVDAMVNCSTLLKEMMLLPESIAMNRQALALDPHCSGAHLNLAICLLLQGDLPAGLRHYEWRWKTDQLRDAARELDRPLWLGQTSVEGKTILLHAEQGMGDTLQFCRYARLLATKGAHVILEVQPPLVELLTGIDGADRVVAQGMPLPSFDLQCPLLSLPLAMGTTLPTIPAQSIYVRPHPNKVELWKARLGSARRPRVGLVWSGRPEHKNDHNRSIPFDTFAQALHSDMEFHCLQKEFRESDLAAVRDNGAVALWNAELASFADTAALIAHMDLIVSVDTSVAHLAAAMGRPVWLLLPFSPDWRWVAGRNDSPWYPTMRLFRQSSAGQWGAPLQLVRQELLAWTASHVPVL